MPSCRSGWFVAIGLFLGCPAAARPNVGYFAGSGQNIFLASTADVQMLSEDVTIIVRPEAASYVCRFELRNLADTAVDLQAGFPLDGDWYEGHAHLSRPLGEPDREPCGDPEAVAVAETFRFVARDDDATYHVRYVRHDARQKYKHVFLWQMHFAPHETRTLHVTYDVPASETLWPPTRRAWETLTRQVEGDVSAEFPDYDEEASPDWLRYAQLHWYSYVTDTGKSWAGTIERADFHIRTGLADAVLRESLQRSLAEAEKHPIEGVESPRDLGPLLTYVCLAPSGWSAPVDERSRKVAEALGVEWTPRTVPYAYDSHFEPFTPGPMIAIGWLSTFLPTTVAGVRVAVTPPSASAEQMLIGSSPAQNLPLFRAVIAAMNGVAPADETQRAILEPLVWYAPVAGRTEADLPDDVKAQLAVIDEAAAAAAK